MTKVKSLEKTKKADGIAKEKIGEINIDTRQGFDETIISGVIPSVEKVRYNLFLKGTWNATLTVDNKIYIEVIKGQMLDKDKWDEIKKMAPLPAELYETIEGYFTFDWSKLN